MAGWNGLQVKGLGAMSLFPAGLVGGRSDVVTQGWDFSAKELEKVGSLKDGRGGAGSLMGLMREDSLCSVRSGMVRTRDGVPDRTVRNPECAGEGGWEGVERRHWRLWEKEVWELGSPGSGQWPREAEMTRVMQELGMGKKTMNQGCQVCKSGQMPILRDE